MAGQKSVINDDDGLRTSSRKLDGDDITDHERHVIASAALLSDLAGEPRVIALYRALGDELGITDACCDAAVMLDELALAFGYETRAEFFNAPDLPPEAPDDLAEKIGAVFNLFLDDTLGAHEEVLVARLVALVRDELVLPWPWVALSLFDKYMRDILYWLKGEPTPQIVQRLEPSEEDPAPDVSLIFGTMPDETRSEAAKRLQHLVNEAMRKLTGDAPEPQPTRKHSPIGKANPNGETTAKYAHWYFRNKVLGEPLNEIANTYTASNSNGGPSIQLLKYGIRQAERVLSLAHL